MRSLPCPLPFLSSPLPGCHMRSLTFHWCTWDSLWHLRKTATRSLPWPFTCTNNLGYKRWWKICINLLHCYTWSSCYRDWDIYTTKILCLKSCRPVPHSKRTYVLVTSVENYRAEQATYKTLWPQKWPPIALENTCPRSDQPSMRSIFRPLLLEFLLEATLPRQKSHYAKGIVRELVKAFEGVFHCKTLNLWDTMRFYEQLKIQITLGTYRHRHAHTLSSKSRPSRK